MECNKFTPSSFSSFLSFSSKGHTLRPMVIKLNQQRLWELEVFWRYRVKRLQKG